MSLIRLAEQGWLPDSLIRFGMRRLIAQRRAQEVKLADGNFEESLNQFADHARQSPITFDSEKPNEQHYEVPAKFFEVVLGKRMKYSCGWWDHSCSSLDESEEAMLKMTCERAEIEDGMRVLDLGCGWGSLTLWIAEKYPACKLTALSNSASQKRYIEQQCVARGFKSVQVITADIGCFDTDQQFDRVASVEMFEHVRNHHQLLGNIARWLAPNGQLFVHIFCHRKLAYTFESEGEQNWMGRHFFSGGMMPAENLFRRYQQDVSVRKQWWINGLHYSRTCQEWLKRLDANESKVKSALALANASNDLNVMTQRWRMFFMACAEFFKFGDGEEWGVGHYSFVRNDS